MTYTATRSTEENLGLDGDRNPPELAIYLSVLKEGGAHVKDGESWRLLAHSEMIQDPCRLVPSLERIHRLLLEADLDSVPVDRIYDELRRPTYGVREGLLPLLVALYLAAHWQETSVYEDGTFLLKVGGDEFQRLNKEPEAFAFQHCSVSGVRLEVYHELGKTLGTETNQRPDILTVVRPLVSFAASLPEYVKHARDALTARSRKVRDLLLTARQPVTLLFKEIPEALSLPTVKTGFFGDNLIKGLVAGLKEVIAELQDAYPALLLRIRGGIQDAFGMGGDWEDFRQLIAKRSSAIANRIVDLDLKAFLLRLGDPALVGAQWIESVATLVAKKAPERWGDQDESIFFERLSAFVPRFKRVESMSFMRTSLDASETSRSIRLTATRPDGTEADEVFHWGPEEDHRLRSVEQALDNLMRAHGKIALVAAARLFWQQQTAKEKDS